MFPNSLYTYEVKWMEQQMLVTTAAERSRLAPRNAAGRPAGRVAATVGRIVGAATGFVASLAHDSRPALRSREQELAVLGVTWETDPALDAHLARQIELARRRRQSGLPADASAPGRQATSPAAPLPVTQQPAAA